MDWFVNATIYQIYLRAFADADGDGHGDFTGLRDKLDYLEWLGIDCIWLMPVFPSPLKDDGYDVASFYGIHGDFGLLEDFKMTVAELHRRGIRIITDLVVNHTSDLHPWFREARRSRNSPMRDYYVWSDNGNEYDEARVIFLDTETSNWAYDENSGQFYWHRFYSSQPDLNYDNPAVQDELLKIIDFWLNLGIDGFRVDAVPYLFEREDTNCENLPETHAFIHKMRQYVDEHYPGTLLLAEANQWPQDVVHYFGTPEKPEFNMCFHFPVMPRLYMALARQDRTDVVEILEDTPPLPDGGQWATFLRNHDELTLEMVSDEDREFMRSYYAPEPIYRINLGIRRRLAPLMNNDRRKIELMYSMLFTLPGAPVLYYGDEIGMGDDITQSDRNGVRTPMQWNNGENGGFSNAPRESLYIPTISDPEYGYHSINVESQRTDGRSLLHSVRAMIYTRKRLPVIAQGELVWMNELPKEALCFRRTNGTQTLMALHNLSNEKLEIPLTPGETYDDAFTQPVEEISDHVTLPPFGYRWLIERGKPAESALD